MEEEEEKKEAPQKQAGHSSFEKARRVERHSDE